jgi:copper chaperone CopZ
MPDVTLKVPDLAGSEDPERPVRALNRLGFVREVNADAEKGLVAVSYEGGEAELGRIEEAVRETGLTVEPSPGAEKAGG